VDHLQKCEKRHKKIRRHGERECGAKGLGTVLLRGWGRPSSGSDPRSEAGGDRVQKVSTGAFNPVRGSKEDISCQHTIRELARGRVGEKDFKKGIAQTSDGTTGETPRLELALNNAIVCTGRGGNQCTGGGKGKTGKNLLEARVRSGKRMKKRPAPLEPAGETMGKGNGGKKWTKKKRLGQKREVLEPRVAFRRSEPDAEVLGPRRSKWEPLRLTSSGVSHGKKHSRDLKEDWCRESMTFCSRERERSEELPVSQKENQRSKEIRRENHYD